MTKKQKPTGTLKKFLDVRDRDTRVIGSLERYLLSTPRSTSRATDVIHPSEMAKADWCHRAEYYELQGRTPAPSKFKASMKQLLTFDEGHRIHARYQDWFAKMGKLHGAWECKRCGKRSWETSPANCYNCFSPDTMKYKEVPLSYEPLRISGHADGWLKGFGNDLLLEIKSVGEGTIRWEDPMFYEAHDGDIKKMWKALNAPFHTHINQVQIYMHLMELMGLEDAPQEAVFIYESKATQEVKEFVVPKNDFGVAPLFEAAEMIVAALDKGTPPPCNIDPVAGCYKCNFHAEDTDVEAGA